MAALRKNYGACPNENSYAIHLLKVLRPSNMKREIINLETELKTDKYLY